MEISLLVIAVLRGTLGIALVLTAAVGLFFSVQMEGVGCLAVIILCLLGGILGFLNESFPDQVEAFMGTDFMDYFSVMLIAGFISFMGSETRIGGIVGSLAVGYMGIVISGFCDAATIDELTEGMINVGAFVCLPFFLPFIILFIIIWSITH